MGVENKTLRTKYEDAINENFDLRHKTSKQLEVIKRLKEVREDKQQ